MSEGEGVAFRAKITHQKSVTRHLGGTKTLQKTGNINTLSIHFLLQVHSWSYDTTF